MITDGSLTPDCNFEVDYSSFDSNSITNEKELFEILKEFLWERSENDIETYLMLNLKIENKDGETFKQNY